MTALADFDLTTIGHSNLPAGAFVAVVQQARKVAARFKA
jgi:hypothetical protein